MVPLCLLKFAMIQSFHPQNPRKLSLHETPPTSMNGRTQSVSGGDWNLASCPTHCPGFMTRETRLEKASRRPLFRSVSLSMDMSEACVIGNSTEEIPL
mmetsp:Transcript_2461/g.4262  ORF Transcript_2461/g.4262 Transcript_2461/m.4262 type:complete len:98 (+) Transcript_2461:176-469(+)